MSISFFETTEQSTALGDDTEAEVPADHRNLVVEAFSATQWRVCDNRWSDHDARSLRGYIEALANQFEVTQLDHGFQWFSYSTFDEAVSHFRTRTVDDSVDSEHVLLRLREHA